MPLPMGHTAMGLAAYELCRDNRSRLCRFKTVILITILSNLPDVDVIIGLLIHGNGNAFHRGPTHSLFFAVIMGFLVSKAWKISSQIPRIKFGACFLIILSHVVGDCLFTRSPVSFFWPFEVNWIYGCSGWNDVFTSLVFQGYQDVKIITGSVVLIILARLIKVLRQKEFELKRSDWLQCASPAPVELTSSLDHDHSRSE